MYIQYGKIYLRVIELVQFEREAVWSEDGVDLLYFDTKIGVVTTYAPGGVPRLDSWLGEGSDPPKPTSRTAPPPKVVEPEAPRGKTGIPKQYTVDNPDAAPTGRAIAVAGINRPPGLSPDGPVGSIGIAGINRPVGLDGGAKLDSLLIPPAGGKGKLEAEYEPVAVPSPGAAGGFSDTRLTAAHGDDRTAENLKKSVLGVNPAGLKAEVLLESGVPGGNPINPAAWHSGAETDALLIAKLKQPRQKLILWAYERATGRAFRWLESPRPGMTVDANNGPHVLSADVVSAIGEPESVAVHVQFQTFVPPCPAGSDKFILSHRWQVEHAPDENHYLSRIVKGTVVFHAGALLAAGVQPDWFRSQLLHPVPVGFRRNPPHVSLSSDGLTLKYEIVDTDPTITFDPGNSACTTIDIQEKVLFNSPLATGNQ